jgi:hypothetical protein
VILRVTSYGNEKNTLEKLSLVNYILNVNSKHSDRLSYFEIQFNLTTDRLRANPSNQVYSETISYKQKRIE